MFDALYRACDGLAEELMDVIRGCFVHFNILFSSRRS